MVVSRRSGWSPGLLPASADQPFATRPEVHPRLRPGLGPWISSIRPDRAGRPECGNNVRQRPPMAQERGRRVSGRAIDSQHPRTVVARRMSILRPVAPSPGDEAAAAHRLPSRVPLPTWWVVSILESRRWPCRALILGRGCLDDAPSARPWIGWWRACGRVRVECWSRPAARRAAGPGSSTGGDETRRSATLCQRKLRR